MLDRHENFFGVPAPSRLLFHFPTAHATSFGSSHTYLTRLHFSGTMNGKQIRAVYAYTGGLEKAAIWKGGQTYWVDIQHLEMKRVGDHFFGKAIVGASSSYEYEYAQDLAVQYWVYFEDGTDLKTDDTLMKPYQTQSFEACGAEAVKGQALLDQLRNDLDNATDAPKTSVIKVSFFHTS